MVASHPWNDRAIAEYTGNYVCVQGLTNLKLQILRQDNISSPNAVFEFGPTVSNPSVPYGAFLLRGTVALSGGSLNFRPISWLS